MYVSAVALFSHTCIVRVCAESVCLWVSVSTGTLESVHSSDSAWQADRIIRLCCRTKKQ